MKILLPAGRIPIGSTVSKVGEPHQFTLMDHKPAYTYGNAKRERIDLGPDHRLMAINVDFGLGDLIPVGIELVWHASETDLGVFLGLIRESHAVPE